jgi:hypothetical protein
MVAKMSRNSTGSTTAKPAAAGLRQKVFWS